MLAHQKFNSAIKTAFAAVFLLNFSLGLMWFFISPYIAGIFSEGGIWAVYIADAVISLVVFSFFMLLVGRWGKTAVFLLLTVAQIVFLSALIGLAGTRESALFIVGYLVLYPLLIMGLDMFVEAHSSEENTGRIRGAMILVAGFGFVCAPWISGILADTFGATAVFLATLACYIVVFLLAVWQYRAETTPFFRERISLMRIARRVFANRDMAMVYGVSTLLEGFYVATAIAFPLYLLSQGMTLSQNGVIFSLMVTPFLFLPYMTGKLADVLWGEKELLIGGTVLMGLALMMVAMTHSTLVWVWAALFFVSRIGASIVETMRDSYYYKHTGGEDLGMITFFRTSRSVGTILAALLIFSVGVVGWPLEGVFYGFALFLFLGALLILPLSDTEPVRE